MSAPPDAPADSGDAMRVTARRREPRAVDARRPRAGSASSSRQLRALEAGTEGVRRIVRAEAGRAATGLAHGSAISDRAVHGARKSLKITRAALRLARAALGTREYRRENVAFRDAARPLGEMRDARVLVDALDLLMERLAPADRRATRRLRQLLVERLREVRRRVLGPAHALKPALSKLESARARTGAWPAGRGWSVLGVGLRRVYRSGRRAFAVASDEPTVENLHEWRKQVKYLWHQLQMLAPMRPHRLGALADRAHELSRCLGDDHDLAILEAKARDPHSGLDADTRRTIARAIDARRAELQADAMKRGAALYAEKPGEFVERLGMWWRAWRAARLNGSRKTPRAGRGSAAASRSVPRGPRRSRPGRGSHRA